VEPLWNTPAVAFDRTLVAALAEAVAASGVTAPPLVSGALHDAVAIARSGVPAAMLFVRSIGGISHNRIEDSGEDDLAAALVVYAAAVETIAARLTAPR
ncbi:MAG TPA: M20/M25/M40 family metallo-hydrolase, partial [Conexibacter sp.]|nr:M20/M25/M40 family metallo-hydrolase [Conexibacter sp.]